MPIKNPEKWAKELEIAAGEEEYVTVIPKVAQEVMRLLDKTANNIEGEPLNADDLITQADHNLKEGITGNQAAYVAMLVSKYHTRGEEFRVSWNTYWKRPDAKGVINPAVVTFKD